MAYSTGNIAPKTSSSFSSSSSSFAGSDTMAPFTAPSSAEYDATSIEAQHQGALLLLQGYAAVLQELSSETEKVEEAGEGVEGASEFCPACRLKIRKRVESLLDKHIHGRIFNYDPNFVFYPEPTSVRKSDLNSGGGVAGADVAFPVVERIEFDDFVDPTSMGDDEFAEFDFPPGFNFEEELFLESEYGPESPSSSSSHPATSASHSSLASDHSPSRSRQSPFSRLGLPTIAVTSSDSIISCSVQTGSVLSQAKPCRGMRSDEPLAQKSYTPPPPGIPQTPKTQHQPLQQNPSISFSPSSPFTAYSNQARFEFSASSSLAPCSESRREGSSAGQDAGNDCLRDAGEGNLSEGRTGRQRLVGEYPETGRGPERAGSEIAGAEKALEGEKEKAGSMSYFERERILLQRVKCSKSFECYEEVPHSGSGFPGSGTPDSGLTLVNILSGLELHEHLLTEKEQSGLVKMVEEYAEKGRRKKLIGKTFSPSLDPLSSETLRFGCYDGPVERVREREDERRRRGAERGGSGTASPSLFSLSSSPPISPTEKVEPLPRLLKKIIVRLVRWGVVSPPPSLSPPPSSPHPFSPAPAFDSCIVHLLKKGQGIKPFLHSTDFERTFSSLFLSSSPSLSFGTALSFKSGGEVRGEAFSLPVPKGSVLVLQGPSADVSLHGVPPILSSSLILITFRRMKGEKRPLHYSLDPELQNIKPISAMFPNETGSDDASFEPFSGSGRPQAERFQSEPISGSGRVQDRFGTPSRLGGGGDRGGNSNNNNRNTSPSRSLSPLSALAMPFVPAEGSGGRERGREDERAREKRRGSVGKGGDYMKVEQHGLEGGGRERERKGYSDREEANRGFSGSTSLSASPPVLRQCWADVEDD